MGFRFLNLPGAGEIRYAVVDVTDASGDHTLVAAVAGRRILLLSCVMIAAGSVNIRLEDGAGGTALSGEMNLTTNSGFSASFNEGGWCVTGTNTLLNLETSANISVDGFLTYVEIV